MYYKNNASMKGSNLIHGLGFGPYNSPNIPSNTLKGKVIDYSTNKPLSAAHVYYIENNKKVGVITNANGEYELQVSPGTIITISFLGYNKVEAPASEILEIEYLSPEAEQLDEIYLTNKKPISKYLLLGLGVLSAFILITSTSKSTSQKPITS